MLEKHCHCEMTPELALIHDTCSLIKGVGASHEFNATDDKTTVISVIEFPRILSKDIGVLYPKSTTYELAITLASKLVQEGTPVNATDILVAAIAIERQMPVKTDDKHFNVIQHVDPRLLLLPL